jgi:hypothetical protein
MSFRLHGRLDQHTTHGFGHARPSSDDLALAVDEEFLKVPWYGENRRCKFVVPSSGDSGRSSSAAVIWRDETAMRLTLDHARSHQPLAVFLLLQPGEYRVLLGPIDFALTYVDTGGMPVSLPEEYDEHERASGSPS